MLWKYSALIHGKFEKIADKFTIVSPRAGTCQCYPGNNRVIYRLRFDGHIIGDYLHSRQDKLKRAKSESSFTYNCPHRTCLVPVQNYFRTFSHPDVIGFTIKLRLVCVCVRDMLNNESALLFSIGMLPTTLHVSLLMFFPAL